MAIELIFLRVQFWRIKLFLAICEFWIINLFVWSSHFKIYSFWLLFIVANVLKLLQFENIFSSKKIVKIKFFGRVISL